MKATLHAQDLFVVLDRAFRRRTRDCKACVFTLPFRTDGSAERWSVIPSAECSETCRYILEDVVAEHQQAYRLSHGVGAPGGRRRVRPRPH